MKMRLSHDSEWSCSHQSRSWKASWQVKLWKKDSCTGPPKYRLRTMLSSLWNCKFSYCSGSNVLFSHFFASTLLISGPKVEMLRIGRGAQQGSSHALRDSFTHISLKTDRILGFSCEIQLEWRLAHDRLHSRMACRGWCKFEETLLSTQKLPYLLK